MDKTVRTKSFPGMRNTPIFAVGLIDSLPSGCRGSPAQQAGSHIAECAAVFFSLPFLHLCRKSDGFCSQKFCLLAGQFSANGLVLSARALGNIPCVRQMGALRMAVGWCPPAKSFLVDRG